MSVGLPSHGLFADNGGEFSNIKLDELTSKLGLTVKFGPSYSPWSNGLNERNHASADLTIKKLLEEKKTALNDSLIKAAAWTHNTSVNKLGYTPPSVSYWQSSDLARPYYRKCSNRKLN